MEYHSIASDQQKWNPQTMLQPFSESNCIHDKNAEGSIVLDHCERRSTEIHVKGWANINGDDAVSLVFVFGTALHLPGLGV